MDGGRDEEDSLDGVGGERPAGGGVNGFHSVYLGYDFEMEIDGLCVEGHDCTGMIKDRRDRKSVV